MHRIIIPTFNRFDKVSNFIKSSGSTCITVVDDASTAQTPSRSAVKFLKKLYGVETIVNEKNLGIIGNHKYIASLFDGGTIFIINDDDWVSSDTLECCRTLIESRLPYCLEIIERSETTDQSIEYYIDDFANPDVRVRVNSFLKHQSDWLLHGIIPVEAFELNLEFKFYKNRPDMWGRLVFLKTLMDGPICKIDVPYIYTSDSKKFYSVSPYIIFHKLFVLVRLVEIHLKYHAMISNQGIDVSLGDVLFGFVRELRKVFISPVIKKALQYVNNT